MLWRIPIYTFAQITLHPGGLIAWLVVGFIAGWLAGRVMKGSGFGIIGDIVVGLVGALLGVLLFGYFYTGGEGFWGSIVVAFLWACILNFLVRFLGLGRARFKLQPELSGCKLRIGGLPRF